MNSTFIVEINSLKKGTTVPLHENRRLKLCTHNEH